jgi:hypothetical protein
MSRIRTVKPDFFIHEGLQDLEVAHPGLYPMFVFQGLWLQCDSNGIFPWRPRQLKLYILPFIPFDMATALDILEKAKYLSRYQSDGKEYGIIPTFKLHQRLSGKEATEGEKYPLPCEATVKQNENTLESQENQDGSNGEAMGKQQGSTWEIPVNQEGSNGEIPNVQEREREREREMNKSVLTDAEARAHEYSENPECNPEPKKQQPKAKPDCPVNQIVDLYHEKCPMLPKVQSWNGTGKKSMVQRWKEDRARQSLEWWEQYFFRVACSDFLTGRVKDFSANLNWLVGTQNMEKIINGAYDNRASVIPDRLKNNIQAGLEFLHGG